MTIIIDHLEYSKSTGVFTNWKTGHSFECLSKDGYIKLWFRGEKKLAHRLAWYFYTGSWPLDQLDHINGIRNDNRLHNLRQASMADNCHNRCLNKNNTTGFKGVYKRDGFWVAGIRFQGEKIHLGVFDTPEEAANAYNAAASKYFGAFVR